MNYTKLNTDPTKLPMAPLLLLNNFFQTQLQTISKITQFMESSTENEYSPLTTPEGLAGVKFT